MGRETYTYKLNQKKVISNLIPALQDETLGSKSFFNYLKEDKSRVGLIETIWDLKYVHSRVSVVQLGTVLNWIWKAYDCEYISDFEKVYDNFGFELIYELAQKDKCWVYGNQMAVFEDMNEATFNFDSYDGYYFYSYHDYKNYLDYLLLLLKKICSDKHYHNSEQEELELPNDYTKTDVIDHQTNIELVNVRKENQEEDINIANDQNRYRDCTKSHYIVAYEMFYQILEVRELVKDYEGKILIFDN